MGAAADVRGGAARRARRQRVRRRDARGGPRRSPSRCGAADRFTAARRTPSEVSRAGAEHLATPPDSVHSLTHFYNWSFAHVRTTYSMKWDGDMVLTPRGRRPSSPTCPGSCEDSGAVVAIPRHPLSIESESEAWIDLGFRFLEPWVYPMGPEFTFVKAFEWEVREFPDDLRADRRARGAVRRAEVARRRRVRALEHGAASSTAPRAGAAQAPRVGRLPRADRRAAATRCPGWSGSRRRPASTSSTTSPTPGCRGPSVRWCVGCRRGAASMSERAPSPSGRFLDQGGEQVVLATALRVRRGVAGAARPARAASTPGCW